MAFAIIAFCLTFFLMVTGGLLLFHREGMIKRIQQVVNPDVQQKNLRSTLQQTGTSLGGMVEQFERVIPKSQVEVSVVQRRLIRAGYRKDAAINYFYASKVITIVVLCIVILATGLADSVSPFLYVIAIVAGYLGPDFWLGRQIKKRQTRVRRGLPDVLDLLVICIEAGLSLDQATQRTAEELERSQPAICDELSIVVLEQRAGRPRADAWKNMAERTGVDNVRNLVTVLVQSEQFGTSIAKTLRTHSETLRTQRIQKVEELAAKTTIKLIFPLVLFIFPSLFLVVLGPAAIMMSESFSKAFGK